MWEVLLEMERFHYHAGERTQGAIALVFDLSKAFVRVSLLVVRAWATHINLTRNTLRVLCCYFEHQAEGTFRRMCGGAAPDHHGHSPLVKVELLAPAQCVAGRCE